MFKSRSVMIKVMILLSILIVIMAIGFFMIFNHIHVSQLRNESRTVAEQVVAFRSWVAGFGSVWVKDVETEFLGRHSSGDGSMFYSKNPALATRELSNVVNNSTARTSFRVTSSNFRNPENKPDVFEESAQNKFDLDRLLVDYDQSIEGYFRYTKPLIVKKACLKCHGDPADAPADVINKYGDKYGFNYQEGDIRGVISVSIPLAGIWQNTLRGVGIWILLLFLVSLLITFLFTQTVFVRPIKKLTRVVDAVSLGKQTNLDLRGISVTTSNEMEKLSMSVQRLADSTQMAIRRLRKRR